MYAPQITVNAAAVHAMGLLTQAPTHPTQGILILTGLNPGTLTLRAPHPKDLHHHHLHQKRNGHQCQEIIRFPSMQIIHFATSLVANLEFA